ncbi:uncharacterized protein [Amphiura filiformis]|uniref:uncharacterized protein n=1 Tax=Amphiura filiformis TaxID=82378 RepID=UPI003B21E8EF
MAVGETRQQKVHTGEVKDLTPIILADTEESITLKVWTTIGDKLPVVKGATYVMKNVTCRMYNGELSLTCTVDTKFLASKRKMTPIEIDAKILDTRVKVKGNFLTVGIVGKLECISCAKTWPDDKECKIVKCPDCKKAQLRNKRRVDIKTEFKNEGDIIPLVLCSDTLPWLGELYARADGSLEEELLINQFVIIYDRNSNKVLQMTKVE